MCSTVVRHTAKRRRRGLLILFHDRSVFRPGALSYEECESDDDRLPRFHIHDLRHTHATHLLMDRWDVARVARRLGHANPAITLKLYAHAITDVQGDDLVTPAAFAFAG